MATMQYIYHTLSLSIMQATSYIPAYKLFSVNILSIHSLMNTFVSVWPQQCCHSTYLMIEI